MRLVLMGTGPFAGPCFAALHEAPQHEVLALVTRPQPRAPGRRRPPPPSPIRQWGERQRLTILEPASINEPAAHEQLRGLAADLFVVCDYGQILSADTLSLTPLGGVNLHGSLLPKYRGAAPVNWALWQGEARTGVTVIHMTPRLDAGPCLAVRETDIGPQETAPELERRLAELGVEPVLVSLELLAAWDGRSPLGTPQDSRLACRAPRLTKAHGRVDWTQPAAAIERQHRALQPWPGTFTTAPDRQGEPLRLILRQLEVVAEAGGPPGQVVRSEADLLWVAAGQGAVTLLRVQPAGRREMDIAEFLRGHPLSVGAQLGAG